jgi:fission process protein 1
MHVTRVILPFTATMTRTVEAAQEKVSDRNADTTDSEIRYLAYGSRLRTALRASTRYIAYVRDPNFLFFVHPHIM